MKTLVKSQVQSHSAKAPRRRQSGKRTPAVAPRNKAGSLISNRLAHLKTSMAPATNNLGENLRNNSLPSALGSLHNRYRTTGLVASAALLLTMWTTSSAFTNKDPETQSTETKRIETLASNRVFFSPKYSRIIPTFENKLPTTPLFTKETRGSFTGSVVQARQYDKSYATYTLTQEQIEAGHIDQLAVLEKTNNTDPMFRFHSVGFPHIEDSSASATKFRKKASVNRNRYKPFHPLVKVTKNSKGETITLANVACMGFSVEKTAKRVARYEEPINRLSIRYGVDADLVKAVIAKESCFHKKAVSHVGAQGLMQLMPDTAEWLGIKEPFDPEQNLRGGIRYLAKLSKQFDSEEHVLAAYNAGPGNVRKFGGIPPFKETRNYVKQVLSFYLSFATVSESHSDSI